jgi:hypothetical protein
MSFTKLGCSGSFDRGLWTSWLGSRRSPLSRSCPGPDPAGGPIEAVGVRVSVRAGLWPAVLLAAVAVLAGGASPASAASGQTLYASSTATNTSGCTSSAAPCSLSAAITVANGDSGDTIMLQNGTYTDPSGGFPTLTSSQSWQGASETGTIVQGVPGMGAAMVQVDVGSSATVALSDLTFTGSTDGAINDLQGTLSITDDTFSNNSAAHSGGMTGMVGQSTAATSLVRGQSR